MERSDFRIIERQGNYGESLFYIQVRKNKMVGGFFGLFGELTEVWEDLEIKVYHDSAVTERFMKMNFRYGFKSRAEEGIQIYLNHLDRKPVEYRGEKLIPILCYSSGYIELKPCYYNPKSTNYKGNYILYSDINEFKKNVDNKLDRGYLIKIHG